MYSVQMRENTGQKNSELSLHKKWSFPLRISSVAAETADLVTFTEEILCENFFWSSVCHFLLSAWIKKKLVLIQWLLKNSRSYSKIMQCFIIATKSKSTICLLCCSFFYSLKYITQYNTTILKRYILHEFKFNKSITNLKIKLRKKRVKKELSRSTQIYPNI